MPGLPGDVANIGVMAGAGLGQFLSSSDFDRHDAVEKADAILADRAAKGRAEGAELGWLEALLGLKPGPSNETWADVGDTALALAGRAVLGLPENNPLDTQSFVDNLVIPLTGGQRIESGSAIGRIAQPAVREGVTTLAALPVAGGTAAVRGLTGAAGRPLQRRLAGEVGIGAGIGATGGVAGEFMRLGGGNSSTASTAEDIAIMAAAAGTSVGSLVKGWLGRPIAQTTTEGQERLAGQFLRERANDSDAAVRAIDDAMAEEARTPGLHFTTGQATQDRGLQMLERGTRSRSKRAPEFTQRDDENLRALGEGVRRLDPDADIDAVGRQAQRQLDAVQARGADRVTDARADRQMVEDDAVRVNQRADDLETRAGDRLATARQNQDTARQNQDIARQQAGDFRDDAVGRTRQIDDAERETLRQIDEITGQQAAAVRQTAADARTHRQAADHEAQRAERDAIQGARDDLFTARENRRQVQDTVRDNNTDAADRVAEARRHADDQRREAAVEVSGDRMAPGAASARIRGDLEAGRDNLMEESRARFAAVEDGPARTTNTKAAAQRALEGLRTDGGTAFPDLPAFIRRRAGLRDEATLNEIRPELLDFKERIEAGERLSPGDRERLRQLIERGKEAETSVPTTIAELQRGLQEITRRIGELRALPNSRQEVSRLGQVADGIMDDIAAASPEAAERLSEARAFFRKGVGRLTRQGQAGDVLQPGRNFADSNVPEGTEADVFVRPDRNGGQAAGRQLTELIQRGNGGTLPQESLDAITDAMLSRVAAPAANGTLSANHLNALIANHRGFLDSFPEVLETLHRIRNRLNSRTSAIGESSADRARIRRDGVRQRRQAGREVAAAQAAVGQVRRDAQATREAAQAQNRQTADQVIADADQRLADITRGRDASRQQARDATRGQRRAIEDEGRRLSRAQGQATRAVSEANRAVTEASRVASDAGTTATAARRDATARVQDAERRLRHMADRLDQDVRDYQRSAIGTFTGERAGEAMDRIFSGKPASITRKISWLRAQLRGDPDAEAGLQQAMFDKLTELATKKKGSSSLTGDLEVSLDALTKVRGQYEPALRAAGYGDNDIKVLKRLDRAAARIMRARDVKAVAGSQTEPLRQQHIGNSQGIDLLLRSYFGIIRGGAIAFVGRGVTEWFTGRNSREQVAEVIQRAMLDPELARMLMMKADSPIFKRRFPAWLATAWPSVDIHDEEDR